MIDFSTVQLAHAKQARSGYLSLDLDERGAKSLTPVLMLGLAIPITHLVQSGGGAGEEQPTCSLARTHPRRAAVVRVDGLVTVLINNDTIRTEASANTKKQFIESPDLSDAVTDAVMSNQTSHNKMADHFFTDDQVKVQLVRLLGELVHENLRTPAV